jgi:uncharacterized membrane protein YbhN (UPF0104 family)
MDLRKTLVRLGGSAVMTALLLYAVFHEQSWGEFVELVRGVKKSGIAAYLFLALLSFYLRAVRYRSIVTSTMDNPPRVGFGKYLVLTAIRNAFVDLLPARLGEASFLYVINRYGIPLITALTTFGLCIALDTIVLLALFVMVAACSPLLLAGGQSAETVSKLSETARFENSLWLSIPSILIIALVLSTALVYLDWLMKAFAGKASSMEKRLALPSRIKPVVRATAEKCIEVANELKNIKSHRAYAKLVLITAALRVAKYGGLYVLLISTVSQWGIKASDLNPLVTTVAFISAEAAASLPISGLMGFGAYEGSWSLVFSLSGVKMPSVTSVILVVHLITQIAGYSLGFLALAVFSADEAKKRAAE